ncbi:MULTISPECIES: phage recombination protein Bet [unclassified Microbacterium]|uniref:phage recombination protein Bet n=1 Tax=unclassified Microbacterium TaxID=2609290 RepID=UPI003415DC50
MTAALMPTSTDRTEWTDEEAAVVEAAGLVFIHQYGENKGQKVLAPRPVIAKFMHICERTGLDPLARQIYCIGRFGSDGLEWSVQTGIDGFRVIAERSKVYAGQDEPEWLTKDHGWVQAFIKELHGDHPLAARVKVYRHDWDRPMVGIATWDEYAQTKRNGSLTAMWEQRGPGQLAKCAEALAFRKAFPQDLSGLYTDEEMQSQDVEIGEGDTEGAAAPRRRRGIPTLADRARAAEEEAAAAADPAQPDVVDAELVDEEPVADPETTDAAAETEDGHVCSQCGQPRAGEEGGICGPCEDEIEAEIATGEEQES